MFSWVLEGDGATDPAPESAGLDLGDIVAIGQRWKTMDRRNFKGLSGSCHIAVKYRKHGIEIGRVPVLETRRAQRDASGAKPYSISAMIR